jgi:4'-phosphopantetheinyl transferase
MSELTLSRDRIDLWTASVTELDEARLRRCRTLLMEGERARECRFHFERDRRRYVVTRALLRTVLSRYATTTPAAWQFTTNAYGRPEISNAGELERALSFNLSHTAEIVLLGVTRETALGVDIEGVRDDRALLEVADNFFAPSECADLRRQRAIDAMERFFAYWTLKESYIKATGMGLAIPLYTFAFDLTTHGDVGFTCASVSAPPVSWWFWQLQAGAEHLAAVCAGRQGDRSPALTLRKAVLFGADAPLSWRLIRQTAPSLADGTATQTPIGRTRHRSDLTRPRQPWVFAAAERPIVDRDPGDESLEPQSPVP